MNASAIVHLEALNSGPTASDRMTFAVFLAGCLHALILFGLGFGMPALNLPKPPMTLDVVLATNFSQKKPDQADFLGQANQEGGGNSKTAKPPRTGSQSMMPSPDPHPTMEAMQGGETAKAATLHTIVSSRGDRRQVASDAQDEVAPVPQTINTASLVARSMEIAALSAELAEQQELQAREPRKKVIAASVVGTAEAPYFDAWRRRIESTGNRFFPKGIQLTKELILRADINADGSLRDVTILQSSGDPKIDHAAREIVHKAQPFPPFSAQMRSQYEVLQIVRLWRFEPGQGLTTGVE